MRFLMDMSGLENMIQGGIRGALAVEDPILRAEAVAGVAAAAEAGAGAQRVNRRVDLLENPHRDLLALSLSRGHHLLEDLVPGQDLLCLLFRRKQARALPS